MNTAKENITIIIPCNHSQGDLLELLRAILSGTHLPKEILIIWSGLVAESLDSDGFKKLFSHDLNASRIPCDLSIKSYYLPGSFPGDARNIGVMHSSYNVIAFLDVKTIPTPSWLENAYRALENNDIDGVWGVRKYEASSLLGGLIRDAIYGRRPVRSLAGTVCRKEVFNTVGQMVPWCPAGEDGDWIRRVEVHKLVFLSGSEANHTYHGLDKKSFFFFIRKWWRYYHYSRLLPVNDRDRLFSFGLFYITMLFFAFNWNFKISVALLGSPFVIPHITTSLALAAPALYVSIRGAFFPLYRGTPFLQLFPIRFFLILLIAFVLDFVKIIALLIPARLSKMAQVNAFKTSHRH